jgi:hypothetical protein
VSCCNGTSASQHFLSFLLRLRQPQSRNRRNTREAERRPRAPPLRLTQLPLRRRPRLTRQRPRLTRLQRPHLTRQRLRLARPLRTSPRHEPRRKLPSRVTRLRKRPRRARLRKRPALRRSSLPVPPAARPLRPWRGTRRRRGPLRLQRSNSRKSPAAMPAAAVERGLPNRLNLARAAIWRGKPRQRALRQRRAPGQRLRALRQQHSPLASDTIGPRNKM